ncbi:aminotransferase class I and II domain-containing protein [Ditylenchus destructor]|uniref:Aminotransferase class I and II domain-containing protein n=1 Tax=Ditylenchus destructor TaxID=166010 RepID=A0AAD4R5V1_9BILA|nr:aminotransferase class I and II domain-containing protein [Ditylenchus destructor]
MISARAQLGLSKACLCNHQDRLYDDDPYDSTQNPNGFIKLSNADNSLCADIVDQKYKSIQWEKFDTHELLTYPRSGGEPTTLESLAKFINKFCRPGLNPIKAEELILVPGVTTGSDVLSQILFEPEDSVLVPGPNYYRFTNDLGDRGLVNVQVVPALFEQSELRIEEFQKAYETAPSPVRAVMITNPQNPEGRFFTLDELRPIVKWALSKKLFVILDEIYDLTIYDQESNGRKYQTATELFETDEERQYMVWMWGLSKNLSMPGLRVSVIRSSNEMVTKAAARCLMFHHPNALTQFVIREIVNDHDWVQNVYIPTNFQRLRNAREFVLHHLDKLGLPYMKPMAGFYVLVDFRKHLDEPSFEAERRLHTRLLDNKVILSAGETMFASEPESRRLSQASNILIPVLPLII